MSKLIYDNEQLDFNETINVRYQSYDIKDPDIGASSKSYTLEIPLTLKNRRLLNVPDLINSKKPLTGTAMLYSDDTFLGTLPPLSTPEITAPEAPSAPSYEAETEALCAVGRYTTAPSTALKNLINDVIKIWKAADVLTDVDAIYVRGVHESLFACQNWAQNAYNSTLYNNPAFVAKQGFQGHVANNAYIDNGYRMSATTKFQPDNMSFGAMMMTIPTVNGKRVLGFRRNGYPRVELVFNTAANETLALNSNTTTAQHNMINGSYLFITRDATPQNRPYLNGSPGTVVSAAQDYNANHNANLLELCYQYLGNPTDFVDGTISFSFYGRWMNETKMAALYNGAKHFYDNVGGTF